MTGGYYILDALGIDLTGEAKKYDGAWDASVAALASGKPIIAYNMLYGTGVPVSPIPCFGWYLSTTQIVIVSATLHVHVASDDTVTIVDVAPST